MPSKSKDILSASKLKKRGSDRKLFLLLLVQLQGADDKQLCSAAAVFFAGKFKLGLICLFFLCFFLYKSLFELQMVVPRFKAPHSISVN